MDLRILDPFDDKCWHRRTKGIQRIVVHHSFTRSTKDTRRILNARGLSTHYEVAHDGVVLNYLEPSRKVAYHAGWVNGTSVGIDCTHMPGDEFPLAQTEGLAELIAYLWRKFPTIPRTLAPDGKKFPRGSKELDEFGVIRHRNVANTVCPDNLDLEAVYLRALEIYQSGALA